MFAGVRERLVGGWTLALLGMMLFVPSETIAQKRAVPEATLVAGLGSLHHPVSTRVALAQRFFDQGLTFVYAFNHQEALRSFERAARLDPRLAIAHWGIALAHGPNYNAGMDPARAELARQALRRAEAIAQNEPTTTPAERDYIAALKLRFAEPGGAGAATNIEPADAYRDAMRRLMQRHPDDPDAATLFADAAMTPRAWKLWNADGTPAEGTAEIVATLEAVLARNPDHIGANHFYIHAIEASPAPERGLPSADRLLRLAPAAGHLVHMPAHIYDRVGNHAAAARANKAAVAADDAYFRQLVAPNPYQGYYAHNLHFLAISYANQGRYRDATRAAKAFARRVGSNVPDVPRLEEYLPALALIYVRFEKWNEIAGLPAPPKKYGGLRAVWHFARGMAFAGLSANAADRHARLAELERKALDEILATVPADEMWGRNTAADVFAIATRMLDGNLARIHGDTPAALTSFRSAVAADDALAYDEPPPWYLPPREALARMHLAAGQAAAAEMVLREELARRPNGGRALFALTLALREQGKPTEIVERQFTAAWKDADVAAGASARVGYGAGTHAR